MVAITINNQAGIPQAAIVRTATALELQANRDLRPIWHTPRVKVNVTPGGWPLNIGWLDATGDPNVNNAVVIGVHYIHDGHPAADVFAFFGTWTDTASHELLEMLVDPDPASGRPEVADPCATHSYKVRGVLVSSFITRRHRCFSRH